MQLAELTSNDPTRLTQELLFIFLLNAIYFYGIGFSIGFFISLPLLIFNAMLSF